MGAVYISGHSDDCIEVEGDIHEEWYPPHDDKATFLAFSDGTLLSIRYGESDACWRIVQVRKGSSEFTKTEGVEDGDYTDRVTLKGDNLTWCVMGVHMAKAKAPKQNGAPT